MDDQHIEPFEHEYYSIDPWRVLWPLHSYQSHNPTFIRKGSLKFKMARKSKKWKTVQPEAETFFWSFGWTCWEVRWPRCSASRWPARRSGPPRFRRLHRGRPLLPLPPPVDNHSNHWLVCPRKKDWEPITGSKMSLLWVVAVKKSSFLSGSYG